MKRAGRKLEIDAFALKVGRDKLVVMSLPTEGSGSAIGKLTAAEREVVQLAIKGLTNAEIAHRRGASARTVANQLASVYRKLGVASRADLAAKWGR